MTMIVGHRGARNLWPENSLSGFRNLLALPVEAVEFDVHPTKAGELLVMHDATLDRTSDRTGPVADLPAGERHSVRLKDASEGIPTLDEVLEVYAASEIELHIELKADHNHLPYPGFEARVAEAVLARGLGERSILTSFTPSVIAEVRRVAPGLRTLLSFDRRTAERDGLVEGLTAGLVVADVIAIEKGLLKDEWDAITTIMPLDRLGVWTPNSREELEFWSGKGLRQITTDQPDIALDIRAQAPA